MSKSSQLQIRVTPEQKQRIRDAAHRAGMDLSSYVLSRALPDGAAQFHERLDRLAERPLDSFELAALHDLLESLSPRQFADVTGGGLPAGLDPLTAAYVAAMVETAAHRKLVPAPAWVRTVAALPEPWFASALPSMRLYLLANSPAPFRRRNLFVDATIGDRV